MLKKTLHILDKILTFFEEWTLFITVIIALVALFINVILRYGFNYSLAWSEELVRDVIIYTTFIGCSAAVKQGSMIRIDATVQIVPFLKRPLTIFSNVATLFFAIFLTYYGWKMAELMKITHQKTIILKIPLCWLYAILPLTGIMICIRTIQALYQNFNNSPE